MINYNADIKQFLRRIELSNFMQIFYIAFCASIFFTIYSCPSYDFKGFGILPVNPPHLLSRASFVGLRCQMLAQRQ
jgi:hypothetical protein